LNKPLLTLWHKITWIVLYEDSCNNTSKSVSTRINIIMSRMDDLAWQNEDNVCITWNIMNSSCWGGTM